MRIQGCGSATPRQVLTNEMLAGMVDTTDEWIRSRTGIVSRYIADDETPLTLAREAAQRALEAAGLLHEGRERIGLLICASTVSGVRCPTLACCLQRDLGLRADLLAFDINAACSGFIYGLITAAQLVRDDCMALVVGSEVLSRVVDFSDRSSCVLFGDGAGAAVVAASPEAFFWVAEAQGSDVELSITEYIHMDGQAVFRFAVEALVRTIQKVVAQAQVTLDEVDLFVCHQANERIIASAAKRLNVPLERFFMNLARHGNTGAASVPLALDEALCTGRLHSGDLLVMAGFGGGLSAGAVCFRWG